MAPHQSPGAQRGRAPPQGRPGMLGLKRLLRSEALLLLLQVLLLQKAVCGWPLVQAAWKHGRVTESACFIFDSDVQVLFLQEAVRGTASEFRRPEGQGAPTGQATLPEWRLVNGVWALFLGFGLLLTSLLTRQVLT